MNNTTHPGHGTPEPATLSSPKAEDNDPPTPSLTSGSDSDSSVLSCDSSSSTRSILRKMDSVYKKKTVVFAEERNTVRSMPNRDDPVIKAQFKDLELRARPRVKKSADVKKSSSSSHCSQQLPVFESAAARLQWMIRENNRQMYLRRINDPRTSQREKLELAASLQRLTQQQSVQPPPAPAPAPAPAPVEKEQKKEKYERRRARKAHVLAVLARVNAPPPPPLSSSSSSDSDSDSDSYFDFDDDKVAPAPKEVEAPVLVRSPKVGITIRAKSIITSPIIPTSPIMAQQDIVKPFVTSHSALKRFEYSFGSPKIVSPTMEMSMLDMGFRSPYGDAYELFEDPRIVRQY